MIYTFQFHIDIGLDYNEGFDWYENQSAGLGNKFLAAVRNKIEKIAKHPETFGSKNHLSFREQKLIHFLMLLFVKLTNFKKQYLLVPSTTPKNIQKTSIETKINKTRIII